MLGILNEQDPLTTAAMAGGGQALGSGILFLARPPAGTKYKTLNIGVKALAAGTLFHLLTGGYVLKDLETGFDKVKIGLGAAALAGLAGTGRLRSQNVTSVLPRVWDTIGSVPRHALISLASKYAASDAPTKKKIERAVQIMGADPTSETAQRLSRAMDAGGAAFIRVMDKIVPETVTP
jgi:hypothetical protein